METVPRSAGVWMLWRAMYWKSAWVAKEHVPALASMAAEAAVRQAVQTRGVAAVALLTSALAGLHWQTESQLRLAEAAWEAATQTRWQAMRAATRAVMETAHSDKAEAVPHKTQAVPEARLGLVRATMEAAEDWAMEVQVQPIHATMSGPAAAVAAATMAVAVVVRIASLPAPSAAVEAAAAQV